MDKNLIFISVKVTSNKKKSQSSEIVHIGAVKVTKDFKLVSKFSAYIKPSNENISGLAITRTIATISDLNSAKSFIEVYQMFTEWCGDRNENAFIFWGKNDIKMLTKEISNKKYFGNYRIEKYFNYQAYLETKLSKELSLLDALETFEIDTIGDLKDALDFAKNLAVLYQKAISVTDVNQLWFEGKIIRIKSELQKTIEYLNDKAFLSSMDFSKIEELIKKCTLYLEYSESFSKEDRENKLHLMREVLDEIEKDVEAVAVRSFRKESITIQWSIAKKQLHPAYKTIEELKNHWLNIQSDYSFLNKNRRGTYSLKFENFKEIYRSIGIMKSSFCESYKT